MRISGACLNEEERRKDAHDREAIVPTFLALLLNVFRIVLL
jgi:hypothetical protein